MSAPRYTRRDWALNLASSPAGWVVIQDVGETTTGIAIVGYYDDELTFYNPDDSVAEVLDGDTVDDGFIAHYDVNGNLQWTRALTGPASTSLRARARTASGKVAPTATAAGKSVSIAVTAS